MHYFKRFLFFSVLTLALYAFPNNGYAQYPFAVDSAGYAKDQMGTIKRMGTNFIIAPDENPNMRYLPKNLDKTFQEDGLRVMFSGVVGNIPPNIRLIGTPFEVRNIILIANDVTNPDQTEVGLGSASSKPKDKSLQVVPKPTGKSLETAPKSTVNKKDPNSIEYAQPIKKQKGVIKKIADDMYVITTEETQYLPSKLADEFKEDGLPIIFSGKVGNIPPNVRMVGKPLELSEIAKDRKLCKKKADKIKKQ